MRIERKRDAELAKRKGMTIKTIIALIWFGICFVAAYFLVNWLFDTDLITHNMFYNRLFIPRSVSKEAIDIGFMVLIVIVIQFFVVLGYAFASPTGRLRPGRATLHSRDPDPNADHFDYQ